VALAIGLLIGLERGWETRERAEGTRVAGIRTFGVIGLLGAVTALLAVEFGVLLAAAIASGFAVVVILAHWRRMATTGDYGITTIVAAFLVFALGALAGMGQLLISSASAVVIALLLGMKPELHGMLERIDRGELIATLRLLLISVVLLPILPDQGYGPWQALNPYRIWWMVVLIAGVSYVGYVAIKWIGRSRGLMVTSLFGGLVSSTAVTISFARRVQRRPSEHAICAAGIVAASSIMFPRMTLVLAVVAPAMALELSAPLLLAGFCGLIGAWLLMRQHTARGRKEPETAQHQNPLDLGTALQFGALLAAIFLLAKAAQAWLGDAGVLALAVISGMGDVDAIVLSFSAMAGQGDITVSLAAAGILLAAVSNTVVKCGLTVAIGGWRLGLRVGIALAAALVAGGVAVVLLPVA
jgi:uncharacterized membrane protein (DUF4010 family)